MSEETKTTIAFFSIEVLGDDVSIKIEGGAINLAETIANASVHSEEVNRILKMAMMMLIGYEMSQNQDEEPQDEPQTPVFGGVVGQA